MINARIQGFTIRVDALNLRERALLLVASIVLLFLFADSFGFQPLYREKKLLLQDIVAQELQIENLHQRTIQLDREFSKERQFPLEQSRDDLRTFGQQLKSRLDGMLAPDRATEILEEVLSQENGLTLNAVNTRQTRVDYLDGEAVSSLAPDMINRYELELQLEGGYLQTLYFLRALEKLRWKFFWTAINYTVTDYPRASVDLEIYTLGQTGTRRHGH